MYMQATKEVIRRRPLAESAARESEENAGAVVFIGKPHPAWTAVQQFLVERHFSLREARVVIGEIDGLKGAHEVCADIRRQRYNVPILLLTPGEDAISRILGLENGADAWSASDADSRCTIAQVRALLRREAAHATAGAPGLEARTLRAGDIVVNAAAREAAIGGQRLDLTTLEFELLWSLVRHAGQILSRERLAQLIGYGPDSTQGRAIDSLVGRLRTRLGAARGRQIRSIRSVGYMLCIDARLPEAAHAAFA
ncbi:MAG: response regulator transcription factor [Betaproteobacteria bacterium]|nr:response regulator transcription factor [Betaproteobacteria bacterium]